MPDANDTLEITRINAMKYTAMLATISLFIVGGCLIYSLVNKEFKTTKTNKANETVETEIKTNKATKTNKANETVATNKKTKFETFHINKAVFIFSQLTTIIITLFSYLFGRVKPNKNN